MAYGQAWRLSGPHTVVRAGNRIGLDGRLCLKRYNTVKLLLIYNKCGLFADSTALMSTLYVLVCRRF
jgi:hypothetical protein